MTAPATLLPPSSTPLERALDQTAAARMAALPSVVASLWNADTCPAPLLPYLAWAMSVDEWNDGWGVEKKRAVIKESRHIHQHKGTLSAIKRALAAIGQPGATVIERGNYIRHNGLYLRDGTHNRQGAGGWPTYRVILTQPVTIDMAQQIKRLLAGWPAHDPSISPVPTWQLHCTQFNCTIQFILSSIILTAVVFSSSFALISLILLSSISSLSFKSSTLLLVLKFL